MTYKTNTNSWLFSNDPSKQIYKSRDHMAPERRHLLNLHLDCDLTKEELRDELKELRDANE